MKIKPERQEDESYEDYVVRRKAENDNIRSYLSGRYFKPMQPSQRRRLARRGKQVRRVRLGEQSFHPTKGYTGNVKVVEMTGRTGASRALLRIMGGPNSEV